MELSFPVKYFFEQFFPLKYFLEQFFPVKHIMEQFFPVNYFMEQFFPVKYFMELFFLLVRTDLPKLRVSLSVAEPRSARPRSRQRSLYTSHALRGWILQSLMCKSKKRPFRRSPAGSIEADLLGKASRPRKPLLKSLCGGNAIRNSASMERPPGPESLCSRVCVTEKNGRFNRLE